jgi:hypothetical protein
MSSDRAFVTMCVLEKLVHITEQNEATTIQSNRTKKMST